MAGPLLFLGCLSDWRGLKDDILVYSSFWNECSYSLSCLPLQMRLGWLRVGILLLLSMCRTWAFPFLLFAFRLLGRSPGFGLLLLFSSNYESIWLRLSIDSCWAWIISSCFLWTWAYCSKRLAISSRVLSIHAKASFSHEEFEACDFAMTECDSLTSMPRARAL